MRTRKYLNISIQEARDERKERAYAIVQKANEYVKTRYGNLLDKPRRKYMRDMILGTICSKSLILAQIAQKIHAVTDTCQNSHQILEAAFRTGGHAHY